MRDFFKDQLKNLYINTGLRQLERLSDKEITKLLDALVKASDRYGHFSDKRKQTIIEDGIMNDTELTSLNPKKVNQWLRDAWNALDAASKNKLIRVEEEEEQIEVADIETAQKYINIMKENLSKLEKKVTSSSKRFYKSDKKQIKIKQVIVDCPKCENKEDEKTLCDHCMGYGQVKKTLI